MLAPPHVKNDCSATWHPRKELHPRRLLGRYRSACALTGVITMALFRAPLWAPTADGGASRRATACRSARWRGLPPIGRQGNRAAASWRPVRPLPALVGVGRWPEIAIYCEGCWCLAGRLAPGPSAYQAGRQRRAEGPPWHRGRGRALVARLAATCRDRPRVLRRRLLVGLGRGRESRRHGSLPAKNCGGGRCWG